MTWVTTPQIHGGPKGYGFWYDNLGSQSITDSLLTLNIDTAVRADSDYFSLASDQVTVKVDGWYEIIVNVTFDMATGLGAGAQNAAEIALYKNGSSSPLSGTKRYIWLIGTGTNRSTGEIDRKVELAANDTIEVKFKRATASTDSVGADTVQSCSRIFMRFIGA